MIKVLNAGIYCSIQDQGRLGLAKKGIPQGGALDSYSAELANRLLKNSPTDAVVEITFGLGKFEFTYDTYICLSGGHFSPKLNMTTMRMNRVYEVNKGDVLSFGKRSYGARVYLAVQGGIQSEEVLQSRSFAAGITRIRLEKGEELPIIPMETYVEDAFSKVKVFKEHFEATDLECFPGPEFDRLNTQQKKQLLQAFSISEDNNRVGYRLNEPIENDLDPILTSAVLAGTVQLTPSGKLIVLLRDCQVTGGYPRVLQLSEVAISRLSQKVAGEEVRFEVR